jgi:hypothetical protein
VLFGAVSEAKILLQVTPNGKLLWSVVRFEPFCMDIEAYSVAASRYKRAKRQHFFSDIYARTLEVEAEGYAVIEVTIRSKHDAWHDLLTTLSPFQNEYGVIVGQLIGDGILLKGRNQQIDTLEVGRFLDGTFSLSNKVALLTWC